MGLKAKEFHALVRRELDPVLKGLEFRRTRRFACASWCRQERDRWLIIWFQTSPHNGALPGRAFEFTINFELADEPAPGIAVAHERIGPLLDDDQREQVRDLQNRVIARLVYPGDEAFGPLEQPMVAFVRSFFQPIATPYTERDDIWLRQAGEEDVVAWTAWLRGVMPVTLDRFVTWAHATS